MSKQIPHQRLPAEMRRLQANAVPVRGVSIEEVLGPEGKPERLPIAYVDARSRKDVRDLARVHLFDGGGVVNSRWGVITLPSMLLFTLELKFTAPAKCDVNLLFFVDSRQALLIAWLGAVDRSKAMAITTERPGERYSGSGIVFEMGGMELQQLLQDLNKAQMMAKAQERSS